ncbi:hypothetical protein [Nonomuraea insulae]|uniref:Uncharacterized protein n=1 Tax=Nonomuraea insulae TaxID=1616787 RepID=A0ABW1CCL9_9ACTN
MIIILLEAAALDVLPRDGFPVPGMQVADKVAHSTPRRKGRTGRECERRRAGGGVVRRHEHR